MAIAEISPGADPVSKRLFNDGGDIFTTADNDQKPFGPEKHMNLSSMKTGETVGPNTISAKRSLALRGAVVNSDVEGSFSGYKPPKRKSSALNDDHELSPKAKRTLTETFQASAKKPNEKSAENQITTLVPNSSPLSTAASLPVAINLRPTINPMNNLLTLTSKPPEIGSQSAETKVVFPHPAMKSIPVRRPNNVEAKKTQDSKLVPAGDGLSINPTLNSKLFVKKAFPKQLESKRFSEPAMLLNLNREAKVVKPCKAIWESPNFLQQIHGITTNSRPVGNEAAPESPKQDLFVPVSLSGAGNEMVCEADGYWILQSRPQRDSIVKFGDMVRYSEVLEPLRAFEGTTPRADPSSPIRPNMVAKRRLRDSLALTIKATNPMLHTEEVVHLHFQVHILTPL